MKVAIITPVHHLELARSSNVHMALAHLVLKYPGYAEFYRMRADAGDFVMLDNGVAETGLPMALSQLMWAANMVHASEMVLPDALHLADATVVYAEQAFNDKTFMHWASIEPWPGTGRPKNIRFMGVPHGRDLVEWTNCARTLCDMPIDTIGISKFEVDLDPQTAVEGRQSMVRILRVYNLNVAIHFLGMQGNPFELRANPDAARSVDSALACIAASHDVRFNSLWGLLHRPEDWHYDPDASLTDAQVAMAAGNIEFIMSMAGHVPTGWPGDRGE